jgi:hypothetical protein
MRASIVTAVLLFVSFISSHAQIPNDVPQEQVQSHEIGWRTFSPPDKSFSIELPSPPEHEYDPALTNNPFVGESYSALGATDSGLGFYSVEFFCSKGGQANDLNTQLYREELTGAIRPLRGRATSKSILVDGLPGRESVTSKPNSYLRIRSVVAGPRTYILSFLAASAADSATLGMRFFDGFHINRSLTGALPGCPSTEGRLPVATVGNIHVVLFPEYWMRNERGRKDVSLSAQAYEVRSLANSKQHELFFGALSYQDWRAESQHEKWYGRNFYAVSFEKTVAVRSLARTEWKQARRISHQAVEVFPDSTDEPATVKYHGKEYAKSAENWGKTLVSPNAHWIAVYSYSGQKTPANFLMSGLPRQGDVYWDVYDTRTGEKVLAWTAKIVKSPGLLAEAAVWVDDKYLVMPFSSGLEACVIGELPRN